MGNDISNGIEVQVNWSHAGMSAPKKFTLKQKIFCFINI